jgi:hypothetical protein
MWMEKRDEGSTSLLLLLYARKRRIQKEWMNERGEKGKKKCGKFQKVSNDDGMHEMCTCFAYSTMVLNMCMFRSFSPHKFPFFSFMYEKDIFTITLHFIHYMTIIHSMHTSLCKMLCNQHYIEFFFLYKRTVPNRKRI